MVYKMSQAEESCFMFGAYEDVHI